jgi:hypothetical protein
VQARADVGDRDPHFTGSFLGSRHRDDAGLALHEEIVGFLLRVRPTVAVSGDIAHDEPRMLRQQRIRREAEALRGARREVLNENVCASHEPRKDLCGVRVLHIERQAFLRAVEPHEISRLSFDGLVVIAREIADCRALDLDHSSAQVRELAGGERRGDGLLEGDDGDAIQREH